MMVFGENGGVLASETGNDGNGQDGVARRRFLIGGALAGAAAAVTLLRPDWAEAALKKTVKRSLAFHNIHTGQRLTVTYVDDGRYVRSGLRTLNLALRDWRSGDARHMDPRLYDTLWLVQHRLGVSHQPFDLICGYRTARTNAMLRRNTDGVAQNSYHIRGMAADVNLPNVPLSHLRQAALTLKAGGVGYYPESDFVHIDVGPVRHWDMSRS